MSQYSRIYAIGDVHGCARELESLLLRLQIDSRTLVVFLGDYVDRGFESRRVIDVVLELRERCEVVTLMGNHEAMFLDFLERPESVGAGLFILNGGSATLANYAGPGGTLDVPESHVEFLRRLKLYFETSTHFFVHAGVPLRKKLEALDPVLDRETFLWTRGPFLTTKENWGKVIVHGHTPTPAPQREPNRINVDTGCVFGGSLTAYSVLDGEFISVEKIVADETAAPLLPDEIKRVAVRFKGRMPVQAGRPGQKRQKFETMNYNQFGLLLYEANPSYPGAFDTGDIIEGTIGDDHRTAVDFEGQIVRTENRQGLALYGVKIDKVSSDGGKDWVTRPA
jgi:serine/threonine protein phosphatase 1